MKRNVIIALLASALLIVGFQNCSQTGFQFSDETFGKTSYDDSRGPLVVDVAEMIDEEEQETIVADIEVTNQSDDRGPTNVNEREPAKADRDSDEILEAYSCSNGSKGMKKVFVCHHPKGNPANRHTLCVGFPAARALLDQGKDAQRNYLGQCLE